MADDEAHELVSGEGYAGGNIAALQAGGGFRRIRSAPRAQVLGIDAIDVAVGAEDGYLAEDTHPLPSEETG